MSGALPREHRDHAACDETCSRCVPRAVHDKLANRLAPKHGGDRQAAKTALNAWYPTVWATLAADFVMPDAFDFWGGRFDVQFASKEAPATSTSGVPVPNARQTADELAADRRRIDALVQARPVQPTGTPSDNLSVITKIADEAIDRLGMKAAIPAIAETVHDLCATRNVACNSTVVLGAIDAALVKRSQQRPRRIDALVPAHPVEAL